MTTEAPLMHWTVQGMETKMRLQDALPLVSGDWIPSKKGCKKAIERGRVLLNGVAGHTGDWVEDGDRIALIQAKQIEPVNIPVPLRIGFEDDSVLVVWKPAGLHTSGSHPTSLRAQVASMFQESGAMDSLAHPEPAHRLDYATSGWILFGRTAAVLLQLNDDFKFERIQKHYLAIVHGASPEAMTIALPLEGKWATTKVTCWARGGIPTRGEGSLLHIETGTGRTHQIRKHLHALQHGIVGDDRYAAEQHYAGHGLLLCAYRIEFQHPLSEKTVKLDAYPPRKFTRFRWAKNALDAFAIQPLT